MSVRVNDFSIYVATVNGSGSQSSNNVLLRSIFRMGIPVSGKNLFPSNIQGLPTWFTIRVNADGWTGRKKETEILICMNDQTFADDVRSVPPGSFIVHHDHMNVGALRKDVSSIPVPFAKIIAEACPDAKYRKLAVNMVYVGILAELLGITDEALGLAMNQQFKSKAKVIDINQAALKAGRRYVVESYPERMAFPFKVQPMNKTQGKILIDGNSAAGLGAMFAGCSVFSWYPITPSSSLVEAFSDYCEKYRTDETTGRKNYSVIQAEDELAAVGMVLGASWMGARAATATSGPGISLMAEFVGFGYFAEVPAVIFDVQRIGPSTGLPTRTSQGDVLFAATLSHGDTKNICLYPSTVQECFEFSQAAFDLAERFQTPVFVLSDLDLGMNFYMSDEFVYPQSADRGKVLTDQDTEKLVQFGRYQDLDGDGVPYRTLPGIQDRRGVFFTRGSGHNAKAQYTESGSEYVEVMNRLLKKWETAKSRVPAPLLTGTGKNKVGIIAMGSTHEPLLEALHLLKLENQLDVDYLRVRAYPFSSVVEDFIAAHEVVYIVEQNRDAQLASLLKIEKNIAPLSAKLVSVLHYDGLPIHARFIAEEVSRLELSRATVRKVS